MLINNSQLAYNAYVADLANLTQIPPLKYTPRINWRKMRDSAVSYQYWNAMAQCLKNDELQISCGDNIYSLPDEIYSDEVRLLYICCIDTAISPNINKCTNLKNIRLSYYYIEIPDELYNLTNLNRLTLTFMKISSFPQSILKLTNLTALNMQCNDLTTIPNDICKLTNLELLNVVHNKLTTLPDTIILLKRLKNLYVGGNKFLLHSSKILEFIEYQAIDTDIC